MVNFQKSYITKSYTTIVVRSKIEKYIMQCLLNKYDICAWIVIRDNERISFRHSVEKILRSI